MMEKKNKVSKWPETPENALRSMRAAESLGPAELR
jgi:hypothetical protein